MVKFFAGVLNAEDRLDLNEDLTVETLPNGRIEMGLRALRQLFQDRTLGSSLGLLAFIVGHEVRHTQQSVEYKFAELSAEDKRLLECEADIYGTINEVAAAGTQMFVRIKS